MMMLAQGGMALGQGISGMFNRGGNPSDKANEYIGQIPGAVNPYYQPYISRGVGANNELDKQYTDMLYNPGALYDRLGAGYKQSPGYKFALEQAMQQAGNASASGGMLGTPADEQRRMESAQGIASKDFEDYINHVMGLYGGGVSGVQKTQQQGFDASRQYADILGQTLGQQGQYAYGGQDFNNQNQAKNWSNIFSGGAMGANAFFNRPQQGGNSGYQPTGRGY